VKSFRVLDGLQRASRAILPTREVLQLAIADLILDDWAIDDLDGAALIVAAANESFFSRCDVLVYGGEGSELEALANFLKLA